MEADIIPMGERGLLDAKSKRIVRYASEQRVCEEENANLKANDRDEKRDGDNEQTDVESAAGLGGIVILTTLFEGTGEFEITKIFNDDLDRETKVADVPALGAKKDGGNSSVNDEE